MKIQRLQILTALLGPLLLAACGGSDVVGPGQGPGGEDDPPAPSSPSFVEDVNPIFVAEGCTAGNCHGGGAGQLTLGTSAPSNHDALVNVPSSCGSLLLVEPNDPTNSYLLMKLEGTHTCGGGRMPLGGPPLTDNQITTIRNWISSGAPES